MIVASSVLLINEILAIENDKLYNTFLHVAFGSQSLLKPTSDQTGSDTNWRTREGDQRGVNGSQSKFLEGTWPISQIEPDNPLFELGQDRLAIDQLSALRTGLGITAEPWNSATPIQEMETKVDATRDSPQDWSSETNPTESRRTRHEKLQKIGWMINRKLLPLGSKSLRFRTIQGENEQHTNMMQGKIYHWTQAKSIQPWSSPPSLSHLFGK
jgi:hypothetical protein